MSARLKILRELLLGTKQSSGKIIAITGNTARVATGEGTINATIPTGYRFNPEDRVSIQDNMILGRIRDKAGVRVYDL